MYKTLSRFHQRRAPRARPSWWKPRPPNALDDEVAAVNAAQRAAPAQPPKLLKRWEANGGWKSPFFPPCNVES
jgi:hypothetical protein